MAWTQVLADFEAWKAGKEDDSYIFGHDSLGIGSKYLFHTHGAAKRTSRAEPGDESQRALAMGCRTKKATRASAMARGFCRCSRWVASGSTKLSTFGSEFCKSCWRAIQIG